MSNTQNALEQIIEQVPSVDQYGLELLKKKVDFLKEVSTPAVPVWNEPVPDESETPVFDKMGRSVIVERNYETGIETPDN